MQVLVISTPSASKAAIARASMSAIACGLLEALVAVEVEAARIGDGGDAHAPLLARQGGQLLEPIDTRWAEALGVGHDVRLADRHEIGRVEELADRDLMADGPLAGRAVLARQHGLFFVAQSHPERPAPR